MGNKYINSQWTESWMTTATTLISDAISIRRELSESEEEMILPEIIYEPKNDIYVAKFPNGKREVDILKPNHGDEWDLENCAHEFARELYVDADHPDGDYYDEEVDVDNLEGHEIEELEDFILNYLMDNYPHA